MKTIGVTIAIGKGFEEVAEPMLRHFYKIHTLPITPPLFDYRVLTKQDFAPFEDAHTTKRPHWLKAHLLDLFPEYERVVYLDADTFTVAPWLHLVQNDVDIAAVLDPLESERQKKHPWRKQFRADRYFNSGVLVLNRTKRTERMCKMWWELRKQRWNLFVDQDAFNRSILNLSMNVQTLPTECNYIVHPNHGELPQPGSVKVIHWEGVKDPVRFREMRLMSLVV